MNKFELIALSGRAGTGKDYVFEKYFKPLGYYRWALADHFKIGLLGKGLFTYEEIFQIKPPAVRKELQLEGTERGRQIYGENIWLDTMYAWLTHLNATWGINKFCITDARFPNEVEFIQKHGGRVFRIIAPKRELTNSLTPEARKHISETALDNCHDFDGYISNDPKFELTVNDQIHRLLNVQRGII